MLIKKSYIPLALALLLYAVGALWLDQASNKWHLSTVVLAPVALFGQIVAFLLIPKAHLRMASKILMIISIVAWVVIGSILSIDYGGLISNTPGLQAGEYMKFWAHIIIIFGVGQYLLVTKRILK